MATIRRPPELRVVFDTSAIYTRSEVHLISMPVVSLVREPHQDLSIRWYIPYTVRHERQYQMTEDALKLLPYLDRLEMLLGHKLHITPEIIRERVAKSIDGQMQTLGLEELPLSTDKVAWDNLMMDALYRRPPFEVGTKEKGFRDALIVQTFLQLIANSPKTPRTCRVILVSKDSLLREAAEANTSAANVAVLPSIEDLTGLLNTFASEVTEEFVSSVKTPAAAFFFTKGDNTSLYYGEKVADQIRDEFAEQLARLPPGATSRKAKQWTIFKCTFVAKVGQRITWSSRIQVDSDAYAPSPTGPSTLTISGTDPLLFANLFRSPEPMGSITIPTTSPFVLGPPAAPPETIVVASGTDTFHVLWSVLVTTKGTLRSGKIERVESVESAW